MIERSDTPAGSGGFLQLAGTGRRRGEIFDDLRARKGGDVDLGDGRRFAYVHEPGAEVDAVLSDLADAYESAKALPRRVLVAALGEGLGSMAAASSTDQFGELLAMAGVSADSLPDRMASTNELLDALPAKANEQLITAFFGELFTPSRRARDDEGQAEGSR